MTRFILAVVTGAALGIPSLASAQQVLKYRDARLKSYCTTFLSIKAERGTIEIDDFFVTILYASNGFLGDFAVPLAIPAVYRQIGDTQARVVGMTDAVDVNGNVVKIAIDIRARIDDSGTILRAHGLLLTMDDERKCIGRMPFVAKPPES